jgi:ATPase subunit of ABC transporter with duplicated ATPase domains
MYGSVDKGHLFDENKRMKSAESLDITGNRLNSMLAAESTLATAEEFGIFPVLEAWMMPRTPPALLHAKDLSVAYSKCDPAILKELNIKMRHGERVALMGINGGGYVSHHCHFAPNLNCLKQEINPI